MLLKVNTLSAIPSSLSASCVPGGEQPVLPRICLTMMFCLTAGLNQQSQVMWNEPSESVSQINLSSLNLFVRYLVTVMTKLTSTPCDIFIMFRTHKKPSAIKN
jgi:hypothetical protein